MRLLLLLYGCEAGFGNTLVVAFGIAARELLRLTCPHGCRHSAIKALTFDAVLFCCWRIELFLTSVL